MIYISFDRVNFHIKLIDQGVFLTEVSDVTVESQNQVDLLFVKFEWDFLYNELTSKFAGWLAC